MIVEYVADGLDRRILRKVSSTFADAFIYQNQLRPAAQLNEDGSIRAIFIYGTRVNSPDLIVKSGITYRVIHDHLGSPIFVVDTRNNEVVQRMTYDVWGKVLVDSNPGFQPFGFAGGLYDNATGLVRFGARDYDPSIGRWLNKDPIRFEGGWNLYAYADNNPVNLIDPEGTVPIIPIIGAIIGGWVVADEIGTPHDLIDDLANVSSGVLGGYGIGSICNAGLRKAGIDMWARRYPNAGGGGLGIDLNGKNLGRLDWHKFGKGANVKNRPHVDIPSMKIKHWPWK